jgi:hypothetical protein
LEEGTEEVLSALCQNQDCSQARDLLVICPVLTAMGSRIYFYLVIRRLCLGKVMQIAKIVTSAHQGNWVIRFPSQVCSKKLQIEWGRELLPCALQPER